MEFKRILVAVNSPNGRDAAFERALALAKAIRRGAVRASRRPCESAVLVRCVPSGWSGWRICAHARRTPACACKQSNSTATPQKSSSSMPTRVRRTSSSWVARHAVVGAAIARWSPKRSFAGQRFRPWSFRVALLSSSTDFENVLVAVDLSPASEDVLRGAIGLTAGQAVQLTVMHTVKGLEAADAVQSPARWKVPEFRAHVLEDARRTLEAARLGQFLRASTHACRCRRGRQLARFSNTPPTWTQISSSWDAAEASSCLDRRHCASFARTSGRCW